jgi:heptosyltransferase-3
LAPRKLARSAYDFLWSNHRADKLMLRVPRRILVLCTRRLGDVLLATALLRSLRRAYPAARIEVAVNAASVAVLEGNPDVDAVIAVPERSSWRASLKLAWRILRRYELAVSTLSSDRSHVLAWLASARRVGVVPEEGQAGARWKRWLMSAWTPVDLHVTHAVVQYLRLADALRIPRRRASFTDVPLQGLARQRLERADRGLAPARTAGRDQWRPLGA